MARRFLVAWLALILLPAAAAAGSIPDLTAGPVVWRFSGYVKSFTAMTQGASFYEPLGLTARETFWNNTTRLRVREETSIGDALDVAAHYEIYTDWGDNQRLRRAYAASPYAQLTGGSLLGAATSGTGAPQFFNLDHDVQNEEDYLVHHRLDRLYLRAHVGPWDFTVGRSTLTWGPGKIWNPTDYLAAFSPTEIDKEEKAGVDMAYARLGLGHGVTWEAFGAPVRGGVASADRGAAATRLAWWLWDSEFAVSGGWLYDRTKVGFSVDGLLWDAGARAAVTRTTVEGVPNEAFYQAIVNFDYAWGVAWNPYLAGEYFYNGFGRDDPDKYLDLATDPAFAPAYQRGEIFNVGEHYLGVIFRLQPHALVGLTEMAILNANDGSVFNFAAVTWSALQNLDVQAGAQNGVGGVPSEYGGYELPILGDTVRVPANYFLYVKYYY